MIKALLTFCAVSVASLTTTFSQNAFEKMTDASSTAILKNGNIISAGSVTQGGNTDGAIVVHNSELEVVVTSATFGGSGKDVITGMAVAADGSVWICGETTSNDLPFPVSPLKGAFKGATDGFVAKLSADLKTVIAGMYIGGSGADRANAIAIGPMGDVVVVGGMASARSLPTINSFDETQNGKNDGFYISLDATGKSVNSASYLGGVENDEMTSVAVDSKNNAVIGGHTASLDFPTFPVKTRVWVDDGGRCPYYGGSSGHWEETGNVCFDNTFGGGQDAVVIKIQLGGTMVYSAFFGGAGVDVGTSVAVGPDDVAYLLGYTSSKDLPIPAEVNSTFGGKVDGFYAAVSSNGLKLVSAQYVGGAGDDRITGARSVGSVVTAVGTTTASIPDIGLGASSQPRGDQDGFLVRFTTLEQTYCTITGTPGTDQPLALAVDSFDDVYRVGSRKPVGTSAFSAFIEKYPFGVMTWRTPTENPSLCEGSEVSISWGADGMQASDTYSVQRSTNGTTWTSIVSGLKARSYAWTPKAEDMVGSIQMRVRSSRGNVALSPLTFSTGVVPAITTQPQSVMACSGRQLTLSVATTTPGTTYQWRKDGANITGATSATYSIASPTANASGSYDAVLTTSCGSKTSDAAKVQISDSPVITKQPVAKSVSAGSALELSVTAEGPGLTYQWTQNGTAVPAPEGTASTLKIASVTAERQGMYQCTVSSECGRSTKSDEVNVMVTGVDEESRLSVNVWPVPATDVVQLHWVGPDVGSVVIIDNTGSEIRRTAVAVGTTDTKLVVSDLASGSYTVVLETSAGRLTRRFSVVR
ncbi:MAG: immunoglobulin domain-containing protein [Candidatus Kapaibacterium sp.]